MTQRYCIHTHWKKWYHVIKCIHAKLNVNYVVNVIKGKSFANINIFFCTTKCEITIYIDLITNVACLVKNWSFLFFKLYTNSVFPANNSDCNVFQSFCDFTGHYIHTWNDNNWFDGCFLYGLLEFHVFNW